MPARNLGEVIAHFWIDVIFVFLVLLFIKKDSINLSNFIFFF